MNLNEIFMFCFLEMQGPVLLAVASALAEHGIAPGDLRSEQVSLEDVFLALTGKKIRD